jgi:hypothetical protein
MASRDPPLQESMINYFDLKIDLFILIMAINF